MKKIFNMCKTYFNKYKFMMIIYLFIIVVSGICTFILPIISSGFIDYLSSSKNIQLLVKYCICFTSVSTAGIVIGYMANRVYIKLVGLITYEMNKDIITYVQKIRLTYFSDKDIARLTQQITTDSQTIINFCFDFIQNIILNVFKLIIPIFIVYLINSSLVIIFVILIITYSICYYLFKEKLFKMTYETREKQNQYFSRLYEQLNKIRYIKTHGIFDWFTKRVRPVFDDMLNSTLKLQKVQYLYTGLDSTIMTVGQIFLFLIGGSMVIMGKISLGAFTLVSSYFSFGISSIRYFFNLGKQIQEARVSYERLSNILDEPIELDEGKQLLTVDEITIENLSFAYNKNTIFNSFNYTFKKGNSYAILGPNGSGKSTLMYLLMGLYNCECGSIRYNDVPLQDLNCIRLRQNLIGVVEQNPDFINDTIYNNLCLYDRYIQPDKIENLMKKWGLKGIANSAQNALNLIINEKNSNLSGGEKEKLAVIRSCLKNPEVILWDEPTASMDFESTKKVLEFIEREKEKKIVIIITHDKIVAETCDYQIEIK